MDGRTSYITGLTTRDSFTYDKVDHLLTENRINLSGGTAVYSVVYTYDKNGNRLTLTTTGAHQQPAATVNYSYTANSNRLATITRSGVVTTATYRPEGELLLGDSGLPATLGELANQGPIGIVVDVFHAKAPLGKA